MTRFEFEGSAAAGRAANKRADKLDGLFPGTYVSVGRHENEYVIEEAAGVVVNLGVLMKVCAALECKPEELFFNADTKESGYCETCYSSWPVLVFEVKREPTPVQ